MYLVIGHNRLKDHYSEETLETWFMTYIDLLQRFRLVNEATQVSKNRAEEEINNNVFIPYFPDNSDESDQVSER